MWLCGRGRMKVQVGVWVIESGMEQNRGGEKKCERIERNRDGGRK